MILIVYKLLFKCTNQAINNFLTFYSLQTGGLNIRLIIKYIGIRLL
jgi:hypothetical protein